MPIYFSLTLKKHYCDFCFKIPPIRPLRTRKITIKISRTIELHLKQKILPLPPTPLPSAPLPSAPLPPTI